MSSQDQDPWWWRAACKQLAPLFDAPTTGRAGNRTRQEIAAEAERVHRAKLICGRCPVQIECVDDAQIGRDEGIRAGQVLPPLDKPTKNPRELVHGTEGGYRTHLRRGEKPCYGCREANRLRCQERDQKKAAS